jgi:sugar phosphate isomerase/epimerase
MSVFIEKAKDYIIHTHVAGVYADEKLMRGPLHLQGQKVDFPRIYKELGMEVPYTLEFPVYGHKGDAPAARKAIEEAIKLMK